MNAATPASAYRSPTGIEEFQARAGLPNVLARLNAGAPVTVVCLGGSITHADGWRVIVNEWLAKTWPRAAVTMINSGIGGTGSDFGVFRCERDVLAYAPDLVFVEFAVNDHASDPNTIRKAMEGIVLQIGRARPTCDVCFVYAVSISMLEVFRREGLPKSYIVDEAVAEHYGIPSIFMGREVVRRERDGTLVFMADDKDHQRLEAEGRVVFACDGCHPTFAGHQLYADAVIRTFDRIAGVGTPGPRPLPAPMAEDHFGGARMAPLDRARWFGKFQCLERAEWPPVASCSERMLELRRVDGEGSGLQFRFNGTGFGLYDAIGPDSGRLKIVVDDRPPIVVSRFDAYCSYYRTHSVLVKADLAPSVHNVRVEMCPAMTNDEKVACLCRDHAMDDPARFRGNVWFPSALLVVGKLLS